jgi:ABC-type phosphate transport system substrate-binding protein
MTESKGWERKLMRRPFVIILAAAMSIAAAGAADFKVIANSSIKADSVSADELKRIFLETATSFDGGHVEPVLGKSGAAHEAFLKQFVGKTDAALATYYRSLVFTGKASMPKQLGTDADVAAYVAKTKGAIGYVGAATETPDVKVLEVK